MKVNRFDAGEIIGNLTEDPETGFLKGNARVTRIGIFNYMNADGSIKRELRHPHEVFSKKSLDSMIMIPITNDHPKERMVTADNAKQLSIGFTGEAVQPDGQYVIIPINITDKDGIAAVKAGRRELSLGYQVSLEDKHGEYDGMEYDSIQRDIMYNHLSIVDKARAGAACAINIDGSDAIQTDDSINPLKEETMSKVKLDNGLEYEAAPEVAIALEKATKQIAEFQAKADAAIADADKARADADTAKAELAKLSGRDVDSEIKAAVKARTSLERSASAVLDAETIEKLDGMSDADIRKAVVLKQFPDAKLDSVSADYLQARFDSALELLGAAAEAGASQRSAIGKQDGTGNSDSVAKSRSEYLSRLKDSWKNPTK